MNTQPNTQTPVTPQTQPDKGPYVIRRIHLQVEVEHYAASTGKTTGISLTEPITLFEADFPVGLLDFLKARGLSPSEPPKGA